MKDKYQVDQTVKSYPCFVLYITSTKGISCPKDLLIILANFWNFEPCPSSKFLVTMKYTCIISCINILSMDFSERFKVLDICIFKEFGDILEY